MNYLHSHLDPGVQEDPEGLEVQPQCSHLQEDPVHQGCLVYPGAQADLVHLENHPCPEFLGALGVPQVLQVPAVQRHPSNLLDRVDP